MADREFESEEICETDGNFFEELFEMEKRIIAEVDAERAQKKKDGSITNAYR